MALQGCVSSLQVWAIAQIVSNTLGLIVNQCVVNQNQGYWLLSDVLAAIISLVINMQV